MFCLVIIFSLTSRILYDFLMVIYSVDELKYTISIFWTLSNIIIIGLLFVFLLKWIGFSYLEMLVISITIGIIFQIIEGFVPNDIKPGQNFVGIRVIDKKYHYIIQDGFCFKDCRIVKELKLNGTSENQKTQTSLGNTYYSYRNAIVLDKTDYDDECCYSKTKSFNFGLEKLIFGFKVIGEQTYYLIISNLLSIILILIIGIFKKIRLFKIAKYQSNKIYLTTLIVITYILIVNYFYWKELSKI